MLNKTVREVVVESPDTTKVFEQLRIDYCCGGDVPLAEACTNAGLEFENVIKLLEDVKKTQQPQTLDFQSCTLAELTTYIVEKHHTFTRDEMGRLADLSRKVIAAHSENHPELKEVDQTLQRLFDELGPHLLKEEHILFPYIQSLEKARSAKSELQPPPFGSINNPVRMMIMEHEDAGDLLRDLRRISMDYVTPPDGCFTFQMFNRGLEAFEHDLHQHIHLENNILFPRAIQLEKTFR